MSSPPAGHGRHGPQKAPLVIIIGLIILIGNAVIYKATGDHGAHETEPKREHSESSMTVEYVLDPLYRSLQLFHFHDNHWEGHHGVLAYLSRFAASAYAVTLPVYIFAWVFRGGFLRLRHRLVGRDFVVIVGDRIHTSRLARDLVNNGRNVIHVPPGGKSDHPLTGVTEISGDLGSTDFWKRSVRIAAADAVVLLSGDDATNLRWSMRIEKSLADSERESPLPCHLHLEDLHLKKGLMCLLPGVGKSSALDRRYFSRYEIAARLLARRYPLPTTLIDERSFPEHYVIVGFGQLGENVALKLVKSGQQILRRDTPAGPHFEVRSPRVTIIDRLGNEAADAFVRSHPGFLSACDLKILKLDCRDSEFLHLKFLDDFNPGERCSLIFCLENEALVVSTILMMFDACQHPSKDIDGIYLRTILPDGPGDLLTRQQSSLAKNIPIVPFASDHEIWNEDVVLNLSLDLMAERIHETYRQGVAKLPPEPGNPAPAANKSWLTLSPEERDGNRECADHLWAKLRTLGYELETTPFGKPSMPDRLSEEIESHIEELASSEHYRWMAWRLINGWTFGAERDNAAKKHPDLVSYDDLTEAGREKDRMLVRIIPELLQQGRLKARRLEKQ